MKNVFKKILLSILALLGFLLVGAVVVLTIVFLKPELVLNEKNINWALGKSEVLKEYSWSKIEIVHEKSHWNERVFKGGVYDFCFRYEDAASEVAGCLEKILWDFNFLWTFTHGLSISPNSPVFLDSSLLKIGLLKSEKEPSKTNSTAEVNYLSYWDMIWNPLIPNADINFRKIEFNSDVLNNPHPLILNAHLIKAPLNLKLSVREFQLDANPRGLSLYTPHRIEIPQQILKNKKLYIDKIILRAEINKKSIDLNLNAAVEQASLMLSTKLLNEQISSELMKPEVQKDILKNTKAKFLVKKINQTLSRILPVPYNVLPAPLNAMEGDLSIDMNISSYLERSYVSLDFVAQVDLKGEAQRVLLNLNGEFPFDLETHKFGEMNLGLDVKELRLLLPDLAKNKLPPKLIPDSRFKVMTKELRESESKKSTEKSPFDYDLAIKALGKDLITLDSNLLDNPVKMNIDFLIENGDIQRGFIKTLPLKTTLFKRAITIESLELVFKYPLLPTLNAFINFHLPEYLVKLHLEGLVNAPRMVLSSEPPLPLSDIYAVLLFGRPMNDLAKDDSSVAQNTSKIISQGVLSLAVLYYFAGSPIEAIGYDAESNEVSAQIGLGAKNSLRVGGSDTGLNSAGVRSSLGKGWYIDSSVEKSTETANGNSFGVLLERIIAY